MEPTTLVVPERSAYKDGVVPVYVHPYVDLDAAFSGAAFDLLALRPKRMRAQFFTIPPGSDGSDIPQNAIILDARVGGRGVKGEKDSAGVRHSCFKLIMQIFASEEIQEHLTRLITKVDDWDTYGYYKSYEHLPEEAYEVIAEDGPHVTLSMARYRSQRDDIAVINEIRSYLSARINDYYAKQQAYEEAKEAELLPGGRVAIVWNKKRIGINRAVIRRYGCDAVVYVDGNNVGVRRARSISHLRMDEDVIRDVVRSAGELIREEGGGNSWFPHPGGYLFSHGTRKFPATEPTAVGPRDLAYAVDKLIREDEERSKS